MIPNPFHEDPDWKGIDKPIFVKGELMDYTAQGTGDSLQIPLPVLQAEVDPNIRYEQATQSIILTSNSSIMHLKEGSTQAELNMKPVQLRFAPEQQQQIMYVPLAPLKQIYHMDVHEDPDTGAVILMRAGDQIQYASVSAGGSGQTAALRSAASIQSRVYSDVPDGTHLRVWQTGDEWLKVQLDNGITGYMQRKSVQLGELTTIPVPAIPDNRVQTEWKGKKVNLAWEAVYEQRRDPHTIGKLPGINVLSPTWFEIIDDSGNVRSKADMEYVNWAHHRGIEIWALLSNGFDADRTTEALSSYENRRRIITQTLEYAKMYQLDGINIDFESVYTTDGPNVTQFIRELKPLAAEHSLVLSMDVTPKSNSELWSKFLDRQSLAPSLDYMMVMAYDEHWASSPEAGSVASLSWTEKAMRRVLEEDEVPADKLILGIPLYTRIWTEKSENGQTKVSSKAVGMESIANLLADKKLKPRLDTATGQNYVEYKDKDATYKIWIEDELSLKARIALARKLQLAGIASWTRSLGDERAWDTLSEFK
ncbi:glycosyl hydrolase family 18 protein [Paenibacillus bovis]|nr:glycosyl hydrolase family 18 protein [Paenibacillus bovis]